MLRYVLLLLAFLPCLPVQAQAEEAKGQVQMMAAILDPLQLDAEEAQRLCDENPEMIKCEILKERLREEAELEKSYPVLTATFE